MKRHSRESERERVVDAIKGGASTWDQISLAARIGEYRLGLVLVDLFDERKVKTRSFGDTRVYYLAPQAWQASPLPRQTPTDTSPREIS